MARAAAKIDNARKKMGATRGLGTGIYMPHRFTPGASPPPGVKVFLAGHETAVHLYSRLGFPPRSKGGLQFRFPLF
jgi:hypothetical protein